jgi:hypothetical protein
MTLEAGARAPVTDLAADRWNAAVDSLGGSVFLRDEWLRAVAGGGLVDADAAHVVLDADGEITALAACLLTRRCPKLEMFREYYLSSPFAGQTVGVVHSMYAQRSQLLARSEADRARLLTELEDRCLDAAGLFLPMVAAGDPLLDLVRDRGYAVGLLSCTNVLPVHWASLDEYLASRPSRKRNNIRHVLRTVEREGVTVEIRRDAEAVDTLARMVERTARRHGSPLFFDGRFLRSVVTALGAKAPVFVVTAGERVLLSCLALHHGGELVPWCIGLDYDALPQYDQYNALYIAIIRYAIEHGVREVNFGRSTYLIKRKFGCVQRPVYAAITGPPHHAADRREWIDAIDRRARQELAEVSLAVTDGDEYARKAGERG